MWHPLWEALLPCIGLRRAPLLRFGEAVWLFGTGPLVWFTGTPEDLLALAAAWKRLLRR